MKTLLSIAMIVFIGTFSVNAQTTPAKGNTLPHAPVYTCPMHPEIITNKPGKCPKCGMTLVEKKPDAKKPKKTDSTSKKMKM